MTTEAAVLISDALIYIACAIVIAALVQAIFNK